VSLQHANGGGTRQAVDFNNLVPGGVAAQEFHFAAGAIEGVSQQAEQGFIGGSIHGGRGDFDAKFCFFERADVIFGSARLDFDGEGDAVGVRGKPDGPRRFGPGFGFAAIFPAVHFGAALSQSCQK
jgi:hypothetical protein